MSCTTWPPKVMCMYKFNLSTYEELKLILPKLELLVIVGQHTTVNFTYRDCTNCLSPAQRFV